MDSSEMASPSGQEVSVQNTLQFVFLAPQKGEKWEETVTPPPKHARNSGQRGEGLRFPSNCHAFLKIYLFFISILSLFFLPISFKYSQDI